MEKTEKISIGHFTFSMDEEAYQTVKEYIDKLESHYQSQPDGAEIMDSIEARIAELLYERCGRDGAATKEDISSIINILGYPDSFADADGADTQKSFSAEEDRAKSRRKLYRDVEDKKFAGVCGGLAKAMNTDPLWLRIAFIAVPVFGILLKDIFPHMQYWMRDGLFWLAPMIYCILWVCMPKASSARQRWEMRGESGSVDDINRYARSEREQNRPDRNDTRRNGRGCLAVGFGIILMLVGFFGLLSKVSIIFGTFFASNLAFGLTWWIPGMNLVNSLLNAIPIANILVNPWLQVIVSLLIIIPSILFIYGGIILVFDIKTPSWRPGLCLILLWLLLFIGMVPASFLSFRSQKPTIETIEKALSGNNIDFHISGNVVRDLKELQQWMDEHNFNTDDWDELNEWLEDHNFTEPDTLFFPSDTLYFSNDTLYCPPDSLFSQNCSIVKKPGAAEKPSTPKAVTGSLMLISTLLVVTATAFIV